MLLKIKHTTHYTYDQPVNYALQQVRLTPKSRPNHHVLNWETTIEGGRKELSFDDHHNNHVQLVSFDDGNTEITVTSFGEVETTDTAGVVGETGGFIPLWLFRRSTPFTKPGSLVRSMAKGFDKAGTGDDLSTMHALSAAIIERVSYEIGYTTSSTTAEEAIEHGYGVCQDHAHVFIAAARHLGFSARYVSGYLMMDDRVDQEASHAWAEAYINGIGWVGFDVSNQISPDERYVRVATGFDYRDASPISGVRLGKSVENMLVSLQVQQ